MPINESEILVDATDPLGRRAVLMSSTVYHKRKAHLDVSGQITYAEVAQCISDPDLIVTTAQIEDFPERRIYYRRGDLSGGAPPLRRVVVDHGPTPGIAVSWHRTSKVGTYTSIEYGPRVGGGQ